MTPIQVQTIICIAIIAIPAIGYVVRVERSLAELHADVKWIVRKLNGKGG